MAMFHGLLEKAAFQFKGRAGTVNVIFIINIFIKFYLSSSLFLSLIFFVSVSLSLSLTLFFIIIFLFLFLSLFLSLSLNHSLSLSPSLSLSLSVAQVVFSQRSATALGMLPRKILVSTLSTPL